MKHVSRRALLAAATGSVAAAAAGADTLIAMPRRDGLLAFPERRPVLDLASRFPNRIEIAAFDYVPGGEEDAGLFRVRSKDGAEGAIFASHTKWKPLPFFFSEVVKPYLVGRDARDLEELMARFWRREFEFTGVALWAAWAHAELAILDMLGRIANVPVAELLGGVKRREIPLYISSNIRRGEPADEFVVIKARMAETGCRAVKVKVGGRMSFNEDVAPGWTDKMIRGARESLGADVTLYADANGTYDAPTAIRIARQLEEHDFAMFEEPCPGEDITMTAQVAKRVKIPIAGGENLAVMPSWRDAMSGAFDVVQPDPLYSGGMIRCIWIAREAARRGLGFNPHYPRDNAMAAPLIHLSAAAPTLWGYQEYRLRDIPNTIAHSSSYKVENGMMRLPDAAGFGVDFAAENWKRAITL
jgi:L-alanine-DL-glutamate epimerase-like enolase superfamily enzyme